MDVTFTIGHKEYTLQAQDGEERLLRRASGLLNEEAAKIVEQAGRMPEPRLLLLAGLMLADRLSAMEDRALGAEREVARTRQAASGTRRPFRARFVIVRRVPASRHPANPPAARKRASSDVVSRPRSGLRCGKRPKRRTMSR